MDEDVSGAVATDVGRSDSVSDALVNDPKLILSLAVVSILSVGICVAICEFIYLSFIYPNVANILIPLFVTLFAKYAVHHGDKILDAIATARARRKSVATISETREQSGVSVKLGDTQAVNGRNDSAK